MSEMMPWDEYRDGGDDELQAELAELEAEEQECMAWVDSLADEESLRDVGLAVLVTRPGLAKAHCRHGAYEFALDGETRHAVCDTCGHSWLIALGEGDTDYLPADLPGVAHH
jgi:hypothetical protein